MRDTLWYLFSFYTDLMFAPQSQVEQTVQTQMERDRENQRKILDMNIGTFPKRASMIPRVLPNFECLTRSDPNLNILLEGRDNQGNVRSIIVVRHGQSHHRVASREEAYKLMSDRTELPPDDVNVKQIKLQYSI